MSIIGNIGEVLITEEEIIARAKELGEQITNDHADDDVILVGILRGAVMWMTELMKHIKNIAALTAFLMLTGCGSTAGYLKGRNPKSVEVCSLLDKPSGRRAEIEPDYYGFTVGDMFIVGYGLDFDQRYRQLPYISYLTGEHFKNEPAEEE